MLYLTSQEKRERLISDAVVLQAKGDDHWFNEVKARIENGMFANPEKREQVIVKWIISAERMNAIVVKQEILNTYDKKRSSESDTEEIRNDE